MYGSWMAERVASDAGPAPMMQTSHSWWYICMQGEAMCVRRMMMMMICSFKPVSYLFV